MSQVKFEQSGTAWISKSFESLVADPDDGQRHFDVLIVGSGYGGAIAADTLTRYRAANGDPLDVGVLERGNEYLPGAFPANSTELARHLRYGRNSEGLFDLRAGPDVGALVANGLGGGSLINAGVMIRPGSSVFDDRWPDQLSVAGVLDPYFARVEMLLGARVHTAEGVVGNKIGDDIDGNELGKVSALRDLAGGENVELANVSIANSLRPNYGYVQLERCLRCGDCATGCNHNAKDSLDTNLLVNAHRRGARIYSGATVLRLERNANDDGWLVYTVFTNDRLRRQHGSATALKASKVILSAGTFGSTEILKRSEAAGLQVSRMLGQRCSTNGDTMIVHYDTGKAVNAIGKEADAADRRQVGPSINAILDFREHDDPDLNGLLIEEMASPASMRRVFQEIYATANTLHRLGDCDRSTHRTGFPDDDIYELKSEQIDGSALYAVMGDDGAHGEIEVTGALDDELVDGTGRIRWSDVANNPLFEQQLRALRKLTQGKEGHIIPNPLWQLLPDSMALITKIEKGPVVTVHPLGGCAMATRSTDGVVNHAGAVFSGNDSTDVHEGLAVLDGSIVPVALGVNPALTIAAVSLRAANRLAENWGYQRGDHAWSPAAQAGVTLSEEVRAEFFAGLNTPGPLPRPRFRSADEVRKPFEPDETMVRLTERMAGKVRLGPPWRPSREWMVELTLRFDAKSLRELTNPSSGNARINVLTGGNDPVVTSKLRIFDPRVHEIANRRARPPRELEELLDSQARFVSTVSQGSLVIFERHWSWSLWRIARSVIAWARNHGLRDIFQAWQSRDARRERPGPALLRSLIALASHAGEVRTFRYELTLDTPVDSDLCRTPWGRTRIRGEKRFSYGMLSNPWNQLMQLRLRRFPGLMFWRRGTLDLDLPFLARIRIPLLEIVKQNDGMTALAELGSFFAYIGRMLIGIHGMNFRAPDEPRDEMQPERLPGKVVGVAGEPEIFHVYMGRERPARSEQDDDHLVPAYLRLARYVNLASGKPPLVMLHGYSASGTTFAHNAIDENFVRHFHDQGRDVWVADFRTSCGMPTAREPWSFEQVGYRDIPELVKFVCERSDYIDPSTVTDANPGHAKVDVIAHCMGAAMFSMALLHANRDLSDQFANQDARRSLPGRIGRVVFTQVGPLLVMSPMNVFRGYVMQYFRELLPDNYDFNPGNHASVADQLLDRLLATVPYPRDEYRVENPVLPWRRTPWTRTRHRMDILYGRVFNAANLNKNVLRHIDDFFGPLSIETVSQTINFARYNVIADTEGRNTFVSRRNLGLNLQDIPFCQLNARDNGLVDYKTAYRMESIFRDAGRSFEFDFVEYAGHQDCLIGTSPRRDTLARASAFLNRRKSRLNKTAPADSGLVAYPPWIGPIRTFESVDGTVRSFRVGTRPTHHYSDGALVFRVASNDSEITMPNGTSFTNKAAGREYLLHHAYFMTSRALREQYWGKFEFPPIPGQLAPPGDAWMVLMLYSEAEELRDMAAAVYQPVARQLPDATLATDQMAAAEGRFRLVLSRGDEIKTATLGFDPATFRLPPEQVPPVTVAKAQSVAQPGDGFCSLLIDMRPATNEFVAKILDSTMHIVSRQDARPSFHGELNQANRPDLVSDAEYDQYYSGFLPSLLGVDAALDRLADENLALHDGLMPDVAAAADGVCEFVLSSCQYPAGFLDGPLAYASYRETLQRLRLADHPGDRDAGDDAAPIVPRFAVLTGDQIYADASAGLFDPSVKRGRFELPYHMWLRFPYVRAVMRQLPTFMLPDDHEITDNWEPIPGDAGNDALQQSGMDGYRKFQRGRGLASHYDVVNDGCRFMMIDTRQHREARNVRTLNSSGIVRRATINAIGDRIAARRPGEPPMFIVTPSMLLPRHRRAAQWDAAESSLRSDSWDGYPNSLFRLLQQTVDNNASNVVFLSGDEHMPCYARLVIRNRQTGAKAVVHTLHTSAAYAPFPFANGFEAQQIPAETLYFNVGQDGVSYRSSAVATAAINAADYGYECAVSTEYPRAVDGMTYIRVWRDADHWSLRAEFGQDRITIGDLAA